MVSRSVSGYLKKERLLMKATEVIIIGPLEVGLNEREMTTKRSIFIDLNLFEKNPF